MTSALFFSVMISYAQTITSDSLRINPGSEMNTMLNTFSKSNFVFNKTIKWINTTYKNPDNVIVGKNENESITISGHQPYAIQWKSLGVIGGYGMSYHIYFAFKDSSISYHFIIDELRNESPPESALISPLLFCSSFFKNDGSVRPAYVNYKNQLEKNINNLLFSYIKILNEVSISSDDALTELKKAKDKLDLGLITQEEYDKQKAELARYIK